ncbi:hypothetical protein [Chitinophaga sp. Cy-1792]|uniref:hypothetical protein n=1 Tax=Chitinophaga sp. Cy-1792 TaxID=2608339 RepID=UPI0014223F25|nr:hypothetical protein [Chitinophaga sp. Cy-1792]
MEKKVFKEKCEFSQQEITYILDERLNNIKNKKFPAAKLEATEKALPKLRELIKSLQ